MLARAIQSAMREIYPPNLNQYGRAIVHDPYDLDTMFQDSAGTTPVTGVEQPVGLMLDKGQGKPETKRNLLKYTNDITNAFWNKSALHTITGGQTDPFGGNNATRITKGTSGAIYPLSVDFTAYDGQTKSIWIRTVTGSATARILSHYAVAASNVSIDTTWRRFSIPVNTTETGGSLYYLIDYRGGTATDVIVYGPQCEVGAAATDYQAITTGLNGEWTPGYHFSQSTADSRPTLRALWNMIIGSNSPATQNVTTLAANYTLSFSGTGTITLSGTATGAKSAGTNTFTATAGTLTLTVSGTVTNAQLVATNMAHLPYQSVTNSTTYDSDPSKFPWYLEFTNHWMVTPSINASTWDKVVLACGVRKMSDVSSAILIEFSTSSTATKNTFSLFAPSSNGANSYRFYSRGNAAAYVPVGTGVFAAAPDSSALVCVADISAPVVKLFRNGALDESNTETQGTGNYGNYEMYLGERGGVSTPFVGRYMGSTVALVIALPNDNIIAALSRYYAQKAGIRI